MFCKLADDFLDAGRFNIAEAGLFLVALDVALHVAALGAGFLLKRPSRQLYARGDGRQAIM